MKHNFFISEKSLVILELIFYIFNQGLFGILELPILFKK